MKRTPDSEDRIRADFHYIRRRSVSVRTYAIRSPNPCFVSFSNVLFVRLARGCESLAQGCHRQSLPRFESCRRNTFAELYKQICSCKCALCGDNCTFWAVKTGFVFASTKSSDWWCQSVLFALSPIKIFVDAKTGGSSVAMYKVIFASAKLPSVLAAAKVKL